MSDPYPPWGQVPAPPPAPWGYGPLLPGLPDGVVIAPVGRRIGAYFLSILLFVVTLGIGWIIWGLIVWTRGTSPALQVLGMRAWKENEQRPARWGDMCLRNVVNGIIANISCGVTQIVSFVLFLTDAPRNRSLADRIATTVIVHDPDRRLG